MKAPRYNIYGRRSIESYQFLRDFQERHGERATLQHVQEIAEQYGGSNAEFGMPGSRVGQQFTSSSAASLNFLTDSLTHIDLEMREQQYLAANRWQRFIPVNRGIPRGANRIQFTIYDYAGRARAVSHDGTDFPAVNPIRTVDDTPLLDNGVAVQYTLPELESAQFQGISLDQRGMRAAAMAISNYREDTWFSGDSALGPEWQRGLTNQPTSGDDTVRYQSASGNAWDAASPPSNLAIANQMLDGLIQIVEDSNEIIGTQIQGDVVIALPTTQFGIITTRAISSDHPDKSIATYVMETAQAYWQAYAPGNSVTIMPLRELGGAGASNTDRMAIYVKSDDILFGNVVIESEKLEIERQGTMYRCPIRARMSPLYVARPHGIYYRDGI